jgi:hypothetical protein
VKPPSYALSALLLALVPVSRAGSDVVTTSSGLQIEGKVERAPDGSVTVETEGGTVRLEKGEVASVVPGEGPRAKAVKALRDTDVGDAGANYRLALAFEARGLADLARRAYERVVDADPDHPAARRALGHEKVGDEWVPAAEARRKAGLVLYGGEWLLPAEVRVRAREKRVLDARASKAEGLLDAMRAVATSRGALREAAMRRVEPAAHERRVDAATTLLVDRDPSVRRWATGELASLGDQSALRPLVAVAVRDRVPEVREAAVRAAATFGVDEIAVPLVRALGSEHPGIVANAATALSVLGDRRTVGYLVQRAEGHGWSPSAYIAVTEQTSYIQDFDVEVAQTSFIADPQVGTIQEGAIGAVTVLDAMIQQTTVTRVLLDAIGGFANRRFDSVAQAKQWWRENAPRFPDFTRRSEEDATPAAPTTPATATATEGR